MENCWPRCLSRHRTNDTTGGRRRFQRTPGAGIRTGATPANGGDVLNTQPAQIGPGLSGRGKDNTMRYTLNLWKDDMGTFRQPGCRDAEDALWHINKAREHDG